MIPWAVRGRIVASLTIFATLQVLGCGGGAGPGTAQTSGSAPGAEVAQPAQSVPAPVTSGASSPGNEASPPAESGQTGTCASDALLTCIGFGEQGLTLMPSGALDAAIGSDPVLPGNPVAVLSRRPGGSTSDGVSIATAAGMGGVDLIKLTDSKRLSLRMRAPRAGATVRLRLETGVGQNGLEATAVISVANVWQTLEFDFSQPSQGSFDPSLNYHRIAVFPGGGPPLDRSETYYLDELRFPNAPGKVPGWALVWADEFDGLGLPDAARWDYDTDRNKVGWWNGELQYYSRARLENARQEGGRLILSARRERLAAAPDFGGQNYTSARLVTRGLAVWTYGRVEVRAKTPCGLGTWPAIWMLGSGGRWPDDGEIDLMEQRGFSTADKSLVLATVHTLSGFGGGGPSQTTRVDTACTAFHTYRLDWDATQLLVSVDGVVLNRYSRVMGGGNAQWPFDRPMYLILNVAMGGTLGGAVPPGFVSDVMEVDYVRVYQR